MTSPKQRAPGTTLVIIVCAIMLVLGLGLIESFYLSPQSAASEATSSSQTATAVSSASEQNLGFGYKVSTIPVGPAPYGLAYDPTNEETFVAVSGASSVAVVNSLNMVVGEVPLGGAADFLAFDQANSMLYAALVGNNSIAVIDANQDSVVSHVSVPTSSGWLAYDPAAGSIFSVDREGNSVSVISGTTVTNTIGLQGLPFAAAFDPADGDMYVTNNAGAVFVINGTSGALVDTLQVAGGSSSLLGIAYNPSYKEMFVTSYTDDEVFSVNGTQVAGSLPGFNNPIGIECSTTSNEMFVVNSGNATVSEMKDGAWTNVPVGNSPREVLFAPATGSAIVSNYGNSTLSVLVA